jgi:hypothetical protein
MVFRYKEFEKHIFDIAWRSRDFVSQGRLKKLARYGQSVVNRGRYNHYSDGYSRVLKNTESSKHIFEIVWRSRDLVNQGYLTKLVK